MISPGKMLHYRVDWNSPSVGCVQLDLGGWERSQSPDLSSWDYPGLISW